MSFLIIVWSVLLLVREPTCSYLLLCQPHALKRDPGDKPLFTRIVCCTPPSDQLRRTAAPTATH
jgi:hypothetical protein